MITTNLDALSAIDKAMSTGPKSAIPADAPDGTVAEGFIQTAEMVQALDYNTRQPATWASGEPKMQVRIALTTSQKDDPDDDGTRAVYIKMWGTQKTEFARAIQDAGYKKASEALTEGTYMKITYHGKERVQTKNGGSFEQKKYTYELEPRSAAGVDQAMQPPTPNSDPWAGTQTPPQAAAPQAPQAGQGAQLRNLISNGVSLESAAQSLGLTIQQAQQALQ